LNTTSRCIALLSSLALGLSPLVLLAQQNDTTAAGASESAAALRALHWQQGPTQVTIAANSTLTVPAGYVFLDKADTDRFLELSHNLASGNDVMLAPEDLSWTAYLSFEESGYVKDDDKIDAPALLKTMQEGQAAANAERRRRGWGELSIVGWATPPFYNRDTKRLEWATLLASNGEQTANFATKILGRRGHTSVILVADLPGLPAAQRQLNAVLQGYQFNSGERYAEWRQGDKVAEYGLAALILGGAAAVATKKGLWAVLGTFFAATWKFLAAGVVAAGGWLRSLFKKKSG
jgi:hypothetical protein